MAKRIALLMFLSVLMVSCNSSQQQTSSLDETALRKIPQNFVDGWNHHDVQSIAVLFAEDADFVTNGAVWLHGRSDFGTFHERLISGRLTDVQMKVLTTGVKFLSPDVGVITWAWEMSGTRTEDGALAPPRYGMMTMVAKRGPNGWLVESAENTNLMTPAPPELSGITPQFYFPQQ